MYSLRPSETVLRYDGTFEGFCCAVLLAYERHEYPAAIVHGAGMQLAFGQIVVDVPTDLARAKRVRDGIERRAGAHARRSFELAFLDDAPQCECDVFAFAVYVMQRGEHAARDASDARVACVERRVTHVLNERERMYQFLRFERLQSGLWFARINPNARVVGIMMRHFVERQAGEPFAIYDETHGTLGLYDGRRCALARVDALDEQVPDDAELQFQLLWKRFYDALSNEQRHNPALRQAFMPKRLWANITEMSLAVRPHTSDGEGVR